MNEAIHEFEDGSMLRVSAKPQNAHADFTYRGDGGEIDIYGSVKWDGCMNWSTSKDCMYHFCSPDDLHLLTRVFQKVWVLGRQVMGEDKVDFFYPDGESA